MVRFCIVEWRHRALLLVNERHAFHALQEAYVSMACQVGRLRGN